MPVLRLWKQRRLHEYVGISSEMWRIETGLSPALKRF